MKNTLIYDLFLELQELNKRINVFSAYYSANWIDRKPETKTRAQIMSETNKVILQLQKIEEKIDLLGKRRGIFEKSLLNQAIAELKTAVANLPKE